MHSYKYIKSLLHCINVNAHLHRVKLFLHTKWCIYFMHQYQYVLFNFKSLVETISKQVKQKITVSKNRNLFWMSHAKEQSLQYGSNLVLAVMIYQPNEEDLPVFLLTALAQGKRCVWRNLRRLQFELLQE